MLVMIIVRTNLLGGAVQRAAKGVTEETTVSVVQESYTS
jgi:hypothetical protein